MNILELLKPSEKTALIQGEKRVSFAALLDGGLRFGGLLRAEGLRANKCALVFMPLSIELYTAMIGVLSVGAAAVFIDFSQGPKFVNDSVRRLRPDIVICDNITRLARIMYAQTRQIKMTNIKSAGERASVENAAPDNPAILTFTSGTTGVAKIAVRTHGFLINQYNVLKKHFDFSEGHVDLGTLPVFTLANLAAHITTLLPYKSYKSKINAARLAAKMDKERVTRVICSPRLFAELLKHSELPRLKNAYLGGAPVYPSVLEKTREDVDLHIVYGSTEAEPIASVRWAEVCDADRQKIKSGGGLLVGRVVPEIECEIGDGNEILVSGETVLKGYLGGVGDSENKIRRGGKILHRTGDAGYFDEQGRLWLLGRVSEAVTDEAGDLYPFCAECVLDARFGIRGAVLRQGGERLAVIEKGAANPAEALEALRPQLIAKVVTVKKIPMDKRHGAKIDYARLLKDLRKSAALKSLL